MDAAGRLLRAFNAHDWQGEVAAEALAQEFFLGEMRKKRAADLRDGDHRPAVELREQKKHGWRAGEIVLHGL